MRFTLLRDGLIVYEWTDIDDFCYRPQRVRKHTEPIYEGPKELSLEDLGL